MNPVYDEIGVHYSVTRRTDPNIAKQLFTALNGATRVVNIGAGTGSYEPEETQVVAIEPSSEMISQRKPGSWPVVQAFAEDLPLENDSFSHAMTVLSMHHWSNRPQAYNEICRVATERFVAITWDPESDPFWLTQDYFPEIHEMDRCIFPQLQEIQNHFDDVYVMPLEIPADCKDGLFAAFWKRPEAYLDTAVRQATSPFAKVKSLNAGLEKLRADLESGQWQQRNQGLLNRSSLDVGYKLISARIRKPKMAS